MKNMCVHEGCPVFLTVLLFSLSKYRTERTKATPKLFTFFGTEEAVKMNRHCTDVKMYMFRKQRHLLSVSMSACLTFRLSTRPYIERLDIVYVYACCNSLVVLQQNELRGKKKSEQATG